MDPYQLWTYNQQLEGVNRKNGMIINAGNTLSKEELKRRRDQHLKNFGLSRKDVDEVELPDNPRDTLAEDEELVITSSTMVIQHKINLIFTPSERIDDTRAEARTFGEAEEEIGTTRDGISEEA